MHLKCNPLRPTRARMLVKLHWIKSATWSINEWHIHPSIHHNSVAPEHDSKGKKVTIYIGWKKSLYFIDGRRLEIILAIFKYWCQIQCAGMPVQNNCSQNVPAGYIEYILSLCLFCSLGVVGAYVRCIECQVNFWAWILNLPRNACILFPYSSPCVAKCFF